MSVHINEVLDKGGWIVMNCNVCGTEIPAKSNYCPNCGNAIPKPTESSSNEIIHCKSCHAAFGVDTKYCPNCGLPVERNTDKRYPNMAYTGTGNVQDNTWYGSRYGEQYGKQDGWQKEKQNGFQYGTGSFYKQPFENKFVTVTYDTGAQNQIKSASPAKSSEGSSGVVVKKRKFTPPEHVASLIFLISFVLFQAIVGIVDECPDYSNRSATTDYNTSIRQYANLAGDRMVEYLYANGSRMTWGSIDNMEEFYTDTYRYREKCVDLLIHDYGHHFNIILITLGICVVTAILFLIISRVRKYSTRKLFVFMLIIWAIGMMVVAYFTVFPIEYGQGRVTMDFSWGYARFIYNHKEPTVTIIVGIISIIVSVGLYIYVSKKYKWPQIVRT